MRFKNVITYTLEVPETVKLCVSATVQDGGPCTRSCGRQLHTRRWLPGSALSFLWWGNRAAARRFSPSYEETNLSLCHAIRLHVHWWGLVHVWYGRLQRHSRPSLQATCCWGLPHSHSTQKLPLRSNWRIRWLPWRPAVRSIYQSEQRIAHGWPIQVQDLRSNMMTLVHVLY